MVSSIKSAISGVETKVGEVRGHLTRLEEDTRIVKEKVNTMDGRITSLENKEKNVDSLQEVVSSLQKKMESSLVVG